MGGRWVRVPMAVGKQRYSRTRCVPVWILVRRRCYSILFIPPPNVTHSPIRPFPPPPTTSLSPWLRSPTTHPVAALVNLASNYLVSGQDAGRWGTAHPSIVPYQRFDTADGQMVRTIRAHIQTM